ncbi:MAG TPA: hypothetical protein VI485_19025 [Vicinamibacterales bacterium]|nr:hypothetical protein [Vicinamibacterales bacterium]
MARVVVGLLAVLVLLITMLVAVRAALALTTKKRGIVEARVLFLFDVVTGTWTSIATIDPHSSTGRFAGATGTLWFPSGTTINLDGGAQAYPSNVTGHLCLATVPR